MDLDQKSNPIIWI